jgi:serine/threonine protein kinase
MLATMRHPNLITLVGACPEAFALVYEFLPNGSLEDRLLCKKSTWPLTWKVRTRIIAEICSALGFIHSNKPYPIFHGNLNAGNILLDANFVSKMGDLVIEQPLKQPNITTADLHHHGRKNNRGTICDIDHGEFMLTRELKLWSDSDVHSFGIIIFQLLTGRSSERIIEIVQEAMEKEQLHLIMDATAGDWPIIQAKQLAELGLRCTDMSGKGQPDLAGEVREVIDALMKVVTQTYRPSASALPSDDTSIPSHFICPIFQVSEILIDNNSIVVMM